MKKVYEREIRDFFERGRNAVMVKGKVADTKKFGLKGDKGSATPDLSRGGGRGQRNTPSLQEFSANLKASESDLNEKQKFDMVSKNEIIILCILPSLLYYYKDILVLTCFCMFLYVLYEHRLIR